MAAFKIPENFWKWGVSLACLVFYLSSLMAILTNKGIYSQMGAALLAAVILLYLLSANRR